MMGCTAVMGRPPTGNFLPDRRAAGGRCHRGKAAPPKGRTTCRPPRRPRIELTRLRSLACRGVRGGHFEVDEHRLRRLIEVGRSLVTVLDPEVVLERLLEVARELTGARYAAIGVLDEKRSGLERFVTAGIDEDTHRLIGDLPRGRGVLGVLITDPRPLRLADVGMHAQSYGFPLSHPAMTTFLGVPIVIDGEAWGNLYLTEKAGGEEFTETDEEA